jgi:hypothetical protein
VENFKVSGKNAGTELHLPFVIFLSARAIFGLSSH